MKKIFIYSTLAILLSSCGHPLMKITKQLPPLEDNAEVTVYGMGDTVPEHSEILGGIAFRSNSDWETTMETARKEARAAGGNGLEVQLRVNGYPSEDHRKAHIFSAFILNVNDSIEPTPFTTFDTLNFHDYVVMNEGDTIPCSIVFESKSHLQFVYGHERHGNRKAMSLPKQDLLSYHCKNPVSFAKQQKMTTKLFDFLFAVDIDPGYSYFEYLDIEEKGFAGSGDVRFNIKNNTNLGIHYGCFWGGKTQIHFVASSIGLISSVISTKKMLDYYLDGGIDIKSAMTKHHFSANIMIGCLFYKEKAEVGVFSDWSGVYPVTCTIYGRTLGIGSNLGYDYMLTDHLSIGATIGFVLGKQFQAKGLLTGFDEQHSTTSIDGPYSYTIHPNHYDFTIGLRYYL